MSDLDFLRDRLPGYADYADVRSRHVADEQVRACLGEALAAARDRLNPAGDLGEQLDGLLVRCEFADQRLVRAEDHARFEGRVVDRVHELDRALVECADRAREAADAEQLTAAVAEAERLLDQRFGVIVDAPSA